MRIFVTGSNGYIGRSVATRLVDQGYSVRGLVRSDENAAALAAAGIAPVLGDLNDHDLLVTEAREADVVINAASSLHPGAATALIEGARLGQTKLLHTSGIGLVSEEAEGMSPPTLEHNDDDRILPGPHAMQQALRAVEELFLTAVSAGIHCVIISNAMIYGRGLGTNRESVQLSLITHAANRNGFVSIVGRGLNCWSTVHIKDVVELYLLAMESAPSGAFYFCENGEATFGDIGRALGERLGLPVRFQPLVQALSIYGEMPARHLLGSNSVVSGRRARRELQWSPSQPPIIDWIKTELPIVSEETEA